jgi:signal transduction histidine kinase
MEYAGMAQVATGVLHNVGNVLNSVNLSTHIIRDALASHPRFALLKQTGDLLSVQGDNLDRFMVEDDRGRLIPKLIIGLSTEITAVHTQLLREAEQLIGHVDHVKQIVAMQQNYAKAGGVIQSLPPSEIFEDALRLVHSSVQRHGVTIERLFSPTPMIQTDRHQVIQILVNFIANAVQAIKAGSEYPRKIILELSCDGARIHFVVTDNGVGIPSDDLELIFSHGFTTRKDGHGFGLHSGALAAKNLGGTVQVASAGLGQGARFSLSLPLTRSSP